MPVSTSERSIQTRSMLWLVSRLKARGRGEAVVPHIRIVILLIFRGEHTMDESHHTHRAHSSCHFPLTRPRMLEFFYKTFRLLGWGLMRSKAEISNQSAVLKLVRKEELDALYQMYNDYVMPECQEL